MQANVDVSRLPMNFRAILNVLRWDNLTKKEEPLSGEAYILFKGTTYVRSKTTTKVCVITRQAHIEFVLLCHRVIRYQHKFVQPMKTILIKYFFHARLEPTTLWSRVNRH